MNRSRESPLELLDFLLRAFLRRECTSFNPHCSVGRNNDLPIIEHCHSVDFPRTVVVSRKKRCDQGVNRQSHDQTHPDDDRGAIIVHVNSFGVDFALFRPN